MTGERATEVDCGAKRANALATQPGRVNVTVHAIRECHSVRRFIQESNEVQQYGINSLVVIIFYLLMNIIVYCGRVKNIVSW